MIGKISSRARLAQADGKVHRPCTGCPPGAKIWSGLTWKRERAAEMTAPLRETGGVTECAEQGFAVAVTELLLNSSFDDVMASAARLLGRNMATYLDGQCRDVLLGAPSVIYGYDKLATWTAGLARTPNSPYDRGVFADSEATMTTNGGFYFTAALVKDAVETLATKNVPRLIRENWALAA